LNFLLRFHSILHRKSHLDLVSNFDENVAQRKDFFVEEKSCFLHRQGFVGDVANPALNICFVQTFIMVHGEFLLENDSCGKHVASAFFQILVNEIWRNSSLKLSSKLKFSNFLAKLNGHQQRVALNEVFSVKRQILNLKSLVTQEPEVLHGLLYLWIEVVLLENVVEFYVHHISERLHHGKQPYSFCLVSIYLIRSSNIDRFHFVSHFYF
jgi:hypothetical protein